MGADQSQANANNYAKFLSFYSKVNDLKDPLYGQISIFEEKQNKENRVFLKLLNSASEEEFTNIGNRLKLRKGFNQQNLILLLHYHSNVQTNLCSDSSSWFTIFEYYSDTLQDELNQRKKNQTFYGENHLWILASQLIDACSFLEKNSLYHGDVRPENIFLDNNGAVKIAVRIEFNMLPNGKSSYQKALIGKNFNAYLSPQQLQGFKDMNFKLKVNYYKADVYSFGMTMLESTLLEPSFDCYNFNNYTINDVHVNEKLSRIQKAGYSQLFSNLIRECLQKNEIDRPSFLELENVINEYRKEINDMEPFFNNPKEQVEQQQFLVSSIPPPIVPIVPIAPNYLSISHVGRSSVSPRKLITPAFNDSGMFTVPIGDGNQRVLQNSQVNRVVMVPQQFMGNVSKSPNRIIYQPLNASQINQSPIRYIQQSQVQPFKSPVQQFEYPLQQVQPGMSHVRQKSQMNEELDMRVKRALLVSQQTLSKQFPQQ